jgi:hypothetical protein
MSDKIMKHCNWKGSAVQAFAASVVSFSNKQTLQLFTWFLISGLHVVHQAIYVVRISCLRIVLVKSGVSF